MVSTRAETVAACLIVLVAATLRFSGLGFGLPMAEARPDELTIAFQAMKFGTGDLDPHSFNYPTLHKYVVFGLFGVKYAVGRMTGEYASKDDFLRSFFDGAVSFRLWMRAWSAFMGTLGVALLLRAPGRLVTAALFAVSMLAVRDSHFGVTDTMMVTLVIATVMLCERAMTSGRMRDLLVAAAIGGLATSTKYTAGLVALPVAIAGVLGASAGGRARDGRAMATRVAMAACVMVGAFLLGSPYVVLDFPTFWKDFQYESAHLADGQYVDVGRGWSRHLETLRETQGLVFVLLAGVAAFTWPIWPGQRGRALLWLSFPVAYYVVIGRGETAFFRYALPLLPFLCVALGWWVAEQPIVVVRGLSALPGVIRGTWFAVLLINPLTWSILTDRLVAAGDTRDSMGRWIEQNVPTNAVIVHAGAYTGAPMLQRNVANQTREYVAKAGRADAAGFRKPDDLKWYNPARPMYDVLYIRKPGIDFVSQVDADDLARSGTPGDLVPADFWLELEDYPLTFYASVPESVRAYAQSCDPVHDEAATVDSGPPPAAPEILDQQDALYLPHADYSSFARMGPNLMLYHCLPTPDAP